MDKTAKDKKRNHFLVVDFGSQSLRAMIIDTNGMTLASVVDATPVCQPEGQATQSVEDMYKRCAMAVDTAITRYITQGYNGNQIIAFGITCLRNTLVAMDRNKSPICDAILWQDNQLATNIPRLKMWFRAICKVVDLFYPLSSQITDLQAQAPINKLRSRQPVAHQQIRFLGHLSTYLHYRLANAFVDTSSNMVGYLPLNFKHHTWQPKWHWYYQAFACERKWLPKLCAHGTKLAELPLQRLTSERVNNDTLAFCALASDKVSEAIGTGCYRANDIHVSLGTAISISVLTDRFIGPKPFYPAFPFIDKNTFVCESMLEVGMQLISDFIVKFEQQLTHILPADLVSLNQKLDYVDSALLTRFANRSETAVFTGGESSYNRHSKVACEPLSSPSTKQVYFNLNGYVSGLSWQQVLSPNIDHSGIYLEHIKVIYDALAEQICLQLVNLCQRLAISIHQVYISGGGANSRYLCQRICRLLDTPINVSQHQQPGALGAAVCLAYYNKTYTDLPSAVEAMVPKAVQLLP
ncbi:FGGY family carbohydrate kinase [Thalassotalea ponticola]|uniref:FGGY family carbohydrate kinase n=1 Tax=Thalassotalea ponticola TaxID=1523392 RepID=UPI0025B4F5D7|nr:FGGY family carbohydrate kinase [Thalassotalea ponticola]MDN3651411.1 FGGY family carbohydrate kinase [Thalassotalea ponticola]